MAESIANKKILTKAYVIHLALGIFALCILGKILYIQFIDGDKWQARVQHLTTDLKQIQPIRGNIFSADGSMLATSIPIFEIRMDMLADGLEEEVFYANLDTLSQSLSMLFQDRTPREYKEGFLRARREGNRYYLVKRDVDYNQVQVAKKFPLWELGRFSSGVIFEKSTVRMKPFKLLASRTIGYEREGVQPVGLEGAFNQELSGTPGSRFEKRLAGGIWMPVGDKNEVEPVDGCDIYTTIDLNIQDVATNALRKQLAEHRAHHGCAVLMEVKTGYIKAIANLTMGEDSVYREMYNYAVGEATEPGSTFKLASLMAAMEDNLISPGDTIDTGKGAYRFYDRIMRDSHHGGLGKLTVQQVFEKSSNVGVSRIINDNYAKNPQQFVDRLYSMGLGTRLGLSISGEGFPVIKEPSNKTWSGVTLPWMSIGYETLLTPLQILAFYNAVANDGVMVKPLFASAVKRGGKLVRKIEPEVLNSSIASAHTIEMAKKMLEGVVSENGTASNLANQNYPIAGKTGTAQIANEKYGYTYNQAVSYQASFVGYFPADNPQYSCIVVVNGPSNDVYYGNAVAGPIFKEIADKVFAQRFDLQLQQENITPEPLPTALHIPVSKSGNRNDLIQVFSQFGIAVSDSSDAYPWVTTRTGTDTVAVERRSIRKNLVPNVLGMGLQDALYLLEDNGFRVKVVGFGTVKSQSIPPGSRIQPNHKQLITLQLS